MSKILLVEDDLVISNAYARKLRNEGHQVNTATDGVDALQQVASERPDLIIIDLMLPLLNGLEVIRNIRASDDTRRLPIIVFSNSYLSHLVQEAWKAGANQCLTKATCTPGELLKAVRTALGSNSEPGRPTASGSIRIVSEASETSRLRSEFLAGAASAIATLRAELPALRANLPTAEKISRLGALYSRVHGLTSGAALAGLHRLSRLASALEALLKELSDQPADLKASALATIADALVQLDQLRQNPGELPEDGEKPVHALVIDEDVISRRAIAYSLDKAQVKYTSVADPEAGLRLFDGGERFDLVVKDAGFPGDSESPGHLKLDAHARLNLTPVILVIAQKDFDARSGPALSAGQAVIARPFHFMELAVKSLVAVQSRKNS